MLPLRSTTPRRAGVGLVGVDHADQVHVELHEPGHDRGVGDVKARSLPAGEFRRGRHALHASVPDDEPHILLDACTGPFPETVGHDEEFSRRDVTSPAVLEGGVFHWALVS